jgi:hypothetical protein
MEQASERRDRAADPPLDSPSRFVAVRFNRRAGGRHRADTRPVNPFLTLA